MGRKMDEEEGEDERKGYEGEEQEREIESAA